MSLSQCVILMVCTRCLVWGSDCDDGGSRLGSVCYYHGEGKSTWFDAVNSCKNKGRNITQPMTTVEEQFLVELQKKSTSCVAIWLAMSLKDDGVFRLPNGDAVSFTNWYRGKPDMSWNENCAEQSCNGWNDVECSVKRPFICQAEVPESTTAYIQTTTEMTTLNVREGTTPTTEMTTSIEPKGTTTLESGQFTTVTRDDMPNSLITTKGTLRSNMTDATTTVPTASTSVGGKSQGGKMSSLRHEMIIFYALVGLACL